MAWTVKNLTLDGDKISDKVGSITVEFENAHNLESFHFTKRFSGGGQAALSAFTVEVNQNLLKFQTRRTAEDSLASTILTALNA